MKHRWIWLSIFLGTLGLVLFLGKVSLSSWEEYRLGERAYGNGDMKKALLHYDRAIHWYTPWSRTVTRSIRRVWEIGRTYEQKGEREAALKAYWSLRSSLYGVRSFYTPGTEWIEKANERIAAIWALGEGYSAEEKKMTAAARKEAYLKILQKDWAPKVRWAAATELGFLGWVGGTLIFLFTFLRSDGSLAPRRAILWGVFTFGFYALWVAGLVRA